ncbi:MAG: NERD domain-containing protein [Candidatus Obscuribacterales bacterium]|nr:NERD domain-containing protein [Candidatus Obscuribacterales bacterium]
MGTIGTQNRARIFPQSIPNDWKQDPKRKAEIMLLEKFKQQLGAEWVVFYDVAWLANVRGSIPEDGQTDFIVIHPDFGLLLIELKGGGISYSSVTRTWSSRDGSGLIHQIKDPFVQVERSKYALKEKFRTVPGLSREPIWIFDAVAFPHVRVGDVNVRMDAPKEIIIDCDDLSNLETKLKSIFNFLSAGKKNKLEEPIINQLISLFAPSIEFHNPLSAQFDEENAEIIKLTANQFRVFDGLRRARRLAIGGCAGSGKTVLAVEKAKRLANEGFKTLLTCYNRNLANYLRSISPLNLEVKTFYQICSDSARAAGIKIPQIGEVSQTELDTEIALALCEAMSSKPELRYDAILVDEAQDFHRDWWDALDSSLSNGKHSLLYAFYDDNQKIYRRLAEIPEEFLSFELYDNIRNAQPIFRCAAHYYATDPDKRIEARGPAGRPVEWLKYKSRADFENVLSNLLFRLTKHEQISSKDIALLTPHSLDNKSILLSLKLQSPLALVKESERKSKDQIGCSTINSFKGLERSVIILTELEEDFNKRSDEEIANLLYVGMSRAKNLLIVLTNKSFPDTLLPR